MQLFSQIVEPSELGWWREMKMVSYSGTKWIPGKDARRCVNVKQRRWLQGSSGQASKVCTELLLKLIVRLSSSRCRIQLRIDPSLGI
ncbi:hypothetical protein LINPERHAP1_LOCUS26164 [Linum perenne]